MAQMIDERECRRIGRGVVQHAYGGGDMREAKSEVVQRGAQR